MKFRRGEIVFVSTYEKACAYIAARNPNRQSRFVGCHRR